MVSHLDGAITAIKLKQLLNLEPHPREGGWFRQTWRSAEEIPAAALQGRVSESRSAGTAIYYLLEPGTFSEMHRLAFDEVFHFYLGDPVEMLQLLPDGTARRLVLGPDLASGMEVQTVVPAGVWQGSRLLLSGAGDQACGFALLGCTVSPGFDYADYESGTRRELALDWPTSAALIEALTHEEDRPTP